MTEKEWLTPGDLQRHVRLMIGQKQTRKLRLFGVACCRPFETWIGPIMSAALLRSELLADGRLCDSTMKKWRQKIRNEQWRRWQASTKKNAATVRRQQEAYRVVWSACCEDTHWNYGGVWRALVRVNSIFGVKLVREGPALAHAALLEVFGNPFRPVAFVPEWRTDTAVSLARQIYESREFSAMPILADALQDAGCDNDAILAHCRDANQVHVRGCWVIDLVLGKS